MSNLVNFFFVGFPKSGSTALYDLLKSHPEIYSPHIKEISFFNTDHNQGLRNRLGKDYFRFATTEEDYYNLFYEASGKIKGDFTPIYIYSKKAPTNIHRHNPEAKIIISIREPVSFLRSHHFQSLYNMIEDEPDFIKALSLESSRLEGRNIPKYCYDPLFLHYSSLVDYKNYVEIYTDVFGIENVKIIIFDDIVNDEIKVYRGILGFLGAKNLNYSPPKPNHNVSHALRFIRLRKLMLYPPFYKWINTKFPQKLLPLGAKISHTLFKKTQEKPSVPKETILNLKSKYKHNVEELNTFLNECKLISKDLLSLWGYKSID